MRTWQHIALMNIVSIVDFQPTQYNDIGRSLRSVASVHQDMSVRGIFLYLVNVWQNNDLVFSTPLSVVAFLVATYILVVAKLK